MSTTIQDLIQNNAGYYDRTDTTKNYDKHVFIAGRILQSAEMNEIQSSAQNQIKRIADALFKDGDIVRDARCGISTDSVTNVITATLEEGAIYVRGQVRGIGAKPIVLIGKGTEVIGVWLTTVVYTATDDATLRDPAAGTQGFNEEGAYRLKVEPSWGLETDVVANGEFFPVYYIDDGQLRAKEPPPNLDAVTQAIARYDVDSNGSNYIVSGFRVTRLDDDIDPVDNKPRQVYSVAAGRARVNGYGVATNAARRVYYKPEADLKEVQGEYFDAKAPDANGFQTITTRNSPISRIDSVKIQKKLTIQIRRGNTGQSDTVTMTGTDSLYQVLSVKAGATTYVQNTDFTVSQGDIVWVQGGAAKTPAGGSSYDVECLVIATVQPQNVTDTSFQVKDAYVAPNAFNTVQVDYFYKMPRIDRLYVNEEGKFGFIMGIATDVNPASPVMPSTLLSIAQVHQAWTTTPADTFVVNDGVRMVSMSSLEAMNSRLDDITDMVAQLNLISDVNVRDASKKKGLFVDPFTNDEQRDQGVAQTAAITGGCLQLPIAGTPLNPADGAAAIGVAGVTDITSCDYVEEVMIENTARTSSMKVNPYMAFAAFPGSAVLNPQVDRWVDTQTKWASPETRYFTTTVYAPWTTQWGMHMTQNYVTGQNTVNELAGSASADAEFLRSIDVTFDVTGFVAGERLISVLFDDKEVLP